MRKWTLSYRIFSIIILLIAGALSPFTFATTDNLSKSTGSVIQVQEAYAAVHVNGYFRKNGTYVQPYYRSNPDGNPYNNWSYPGNTNPYTGEVAPGNPDTYLRNYYDNSSGYTPPTYVAPIIYNPTCPSNSYYSSLSNSCKCNSGYAIFDNGTTCESGYLYCTNKYGIHSNYNSLNLSCECSYGYSITNGQCVSYDEQCQNQLGTHSSYNILNDNCKCDYGYYISNGQCIDADSSCQDQFGSNSEASDPGKCKCKAGYVWNTQGSLCVDDKPSCGLNQHLGTDDKCYCDSGYTPNYTKTTCEAVVIPDNAHLNVSGNGWECDSGYILNKTGDNCAKIDLAPPKDSDLSSNSYYTNTYGTKVHSPAYSNTVPTNASAQCKDGTYSFSRNRRGTCSKHGGVSQWLK